mmetsp:Transcript_62449/g.183074  ORF Transcript_62449/g.183074 Transcript_62449/m.183074 type:complete len:506 (-) Transcript_62449:169-1686(-)
MPDDGADDGLEAALAAALHRKDPGAAADPSAWGAWGGQEQMPGCWGGACWPRAQPTGWPGQGPSPYSGWGGGAYYDPTGGWPAAPYNGMWPNNDAACWGGCGGGGGCGDMNDAGYMNWMGMRGRSHNHVPRRVNLVDRYNNKKSKDGKDEEMTTLMIRNVPNQYHRGLLMQELNSLGFRDKYDFISLPMDNATYWNVGYAFVNFEDPQDAAACMQVLHGHEFKRYYGNGKKRVAQVSVAHIQGLEQNLSHCSSTSVLSTYALWRPWVRPKSRANLKGDLSYFDSTELEDEDYEDWALGDGGPPEFRGEGPARGERPAGGKDANFYEARGHVKSRQPPPTSLGSRAPPPSSLSKPGAGRHGARAVDARGMGAVTTSHDHRQVSRTPSPERQVSGWDDVFQSTSPLFGPSMSPVMLPLAMPQQQLPRSRSPSSSPHHKAMRSPQLAHMVLPPSMSPLPPNGRGPSMMSPMMAPVMRPPVGMDMSGWDTRPMTPGEGQNGHAPFSSIR